MSNDLTPWQRPCFEAGGGNALLFFAVYGQFAAEIQLSAAEYRTAGVPAGLMLRKLNRTQSPEFPFTSESIGKLLRPENPALFAELQRQPECLILQGEIPDPADLNYLRDAVGMITSFLEHGGIAAIDPQQLRLFDSANWRKEMFDPEPPNLLKHVLTIYSEDPQAAPEKRLWFHTRGLRKFGRPDLSLRNVPPGQQAAAVNLINRFVLLQANGGLIPEGEEIHMPSLPTGLICHQAGSLEDPEFNNVHVEIRWPSS
jgi:hypothetical protein